MTELIGFWITCVSVICFIVFILYDADLKNKLIMICGMSAFLGMLEIGVYLTN